MKVAGGAGPNSGSNSGSNCSASFCQTGRAGEEVVAGLRLGARGGGNGAYSLPSTGPRGCG